MSEKNIEKICKLISEINMSSRINNVPINISINYIDAININDNHDEHNNYLGNSNDSSENTKDNPLGNINTEVENIDKPPGLSVTPPLSPITYPSRYNTDNVNGVRILNSVNSEFNLNDVIVNPINYNSNTYDANFVDDNNELVDNLSDSLPSSYSQLESNNNGISRNLDLEKIHSKTKIIIYKNIPNGDVKCSICNEDFKDDDICRINIKCNHYYHQLCIDQWYLNNDKCPICNQYLD